VIILIEKGEVHAPMPLGHQSLLVLDGTIAKIGVVDRRALEALGVDHDVIDASGCLVCPGLIDPHQHLIGGSGERGFNSMTPEIFAEEFVQYGITSVVGCLGVDVTMKNMPLLVGKAKGLREEGINAYLWTGGYRLPPSSLMNTVREDILFVQEIIGVGEVAIADQRSMDPEPLELAKVVHDAYDGGLLAGKCGRTHFHVGDQKERLAPLRELIGYYNVEPDWLYVTHVERNEALMREAVELAGAGAYVDIDVVEEDLPKWLRFYIDHGGPPSRLTVSSDAAINSPRTLYEQLCVLMREKRYPMELTLSLATANTARTLKLERQGTVEVGKAADLIILRRASLEIVHVLVGGRWMVRDGALVQRSHWLEGNKREIHLRGTKVERS
jgi:beta-aspartyl-dipeptidase (metallo-type)